jgi:hypothetical protein
MGAEGDRQDRVVGIVTRQLNNHTSSLSTDMRFLSSAQCVDQLWSSPTILLNEYKGYFFWV